MSLWKSQDAASNAPVWTVASGYGSSANGFTLYENTDLSVAGGIGIYGVDTTEARIATGEGKDVAHAGWNLRRVGEGGIATITANTSAVATNSYLTITGGGTGNTPANVYIQVNAAGYVINSSITINAAGLYSSTPTARLATGTTGNAVFTLTMGGRIGRVQYETLVAMGSMTGDGNDTLFPDS